MIWIKRKISPHVGMSLRIDSKNKYLKIENKYFYRECSVPFPPSLPIYKIPRNFLKMCFQSFFFLYWFMSLKLTMDWSEPWSVTSFMWELFLFSLNILFKIRQKFWQWGWNCFVFTLASVEGGIKAGNVVDTSERTSREMMVGAWQKEHFR